MILLYIISLLILFYILSLLDTNTILIIMFIYIIYTMKHYELDKGQTLISSPKIYEYDKTIFIKKIDEERYILLQNSIKEFNKIYNKILNKKYDVDIYYDYMYDIYTTILEICYSLHVDKLNSKCTMKLNKLIMYIRKKYYKMILDIKEYSKNKHLLSDYKTVPFNYRKSNLMLP